MPEDANTGNSVKDFIDLVKRSRRGKLKIYIGMSAGPKPKTTKHDSPCLLRADHPPPPRRTDRWLCVDFGPRFGRHVSG